MIVKIINSLQFENEQEKIKIKGNVTTQMYPKAEVKILRISIEWPNCNIILSCADLIIRSFKNLCLHTSDLMHEFFQDLKVTFTLV